jgi:hypothetical protein
MVAIGPTTDNGPSVVWLARQRMTLSGLKLSVQRCVYKFTHYAEVDPREGISRR